MTGTGFGKLSSARLLMVAAIIAIVSGASVGLGVGYVIHYDAPTTRTFYMFDRSLPFNETLFKIPHDTFVPDTITVNKGDHVVIHFADIESTPEGHTFTMDPPHTSTAVVDKDLTQGGGVAGTFTATPGAILRT